MRGPHRKSGYTELCGEGAPRPCHKPAVGACARCGIPLCDAHWPSDDRRCTACEADFAARTPSDRALVRTESRLVSAASITAGLGLGLASGLTLAWTLSLAALALVFGQWFRMMAHLATPGEAGLSRWLLKGRRIRFLRERSLPAGRAPKRLAQ